MLLKVFTVSDVRSHPFTIFYILPIENMRVESANSCLREMLNFVVRVEIYGEPGCCPMPFDRPEIPYPGVGFPQQWRGSP
jgi:hypothetical protein